MTQELDINGDLIGCPGITFAMTENGSVDHDTWNTIVVHFLIKEINKVRDKYCKGEKRWVLLTMDGFTSHTNCEEALKAFLDEHILIFLIPPHLSHILQALDIAIYNAYKLEFYRVILDTAVELLEDNTKFNKWILPNVMNGIWQELIVEDPTLVQKSFQKAGIWPEGSKKEWFEEYKHTIKKPISLDEKQAHTETSRELEVLKFV